MQLREFLPTSGPTEPYGRMGPLTTELLSLQRRERIARLPSIGPELSVAHEWVRTQAFNRLYLVQNLYTLAFLNAEVRTAIINIRNEVFRRGLRWSPRFQKKCPKCGGEFNSTVEECPECTVTEEDLEKQATEGYLPLVDPHKVRAKPVVGERVKTVPPDEKQKEKFQRFSQKVNDFGQSFEEVLRMEEDDVNITDDAFGLILYEYIINARGEVFERPIQTYRLHPSLVNFDLTSEGEPLRNHFACPIHRDMLSEQGLCKVEDCGLPLRPVYATYIHAGTKTFPLFEPEIVHWSKFSPSATFGFSPLLSIFEKILTLIGMDKFVYRYFFERKMPAAMLVTATDDPESIRREREYIMSRLQNEPDYLPWVATSARTGREKTELVRLFHTLQEMDYLPVRNEIRERVAAIYGVSPIWMGAPTATGGLTAQTSELVVTSRVIESTQRIYNEKILPLYLKVFGVTDWTLTLAQPEEKAESTRIQFATQRVTAARQCVDMGFDVKIEGKETSLDDIRFIVSGTSSKPGAPGGDPGGASGAPLPLPPEETHSDQARGAHLVSMPHRGTLDQRTRGEEGVLHSEDAEEEEEEEE